MRPLRLAGAFARPSDCLWNNGGPSLRGARRGLAHFKVKKEGVVLRCAAVRRARAVSTVMAVC